MNDMFVDARLRDWDATAEAIAFASYVRRLLAEDGDSKNHDEDTDAARSVLERRAA